MAKRAQGGEGCESTPLPRLTDLESVTIVGMGPTSPEVIRYLIKGVIPSNERNPIWVINHQYRGTAHHLAWNTHDLNILKEKQPAPETDFISMYKAYDRPVVTFRPVPGLKTLIYPLKQVAEFWRDTYFFGAPSYMLAYAGWCGLSEKRIRLFGMDYDYPDRNEYEAGRCNAEYWMGRLKSHGYSFEYPTQTSLLDTCYAPFGGRMPGYGWPFYGYFDRQPRVKQLADGRIKVRFDDNYTVRYQKWPPGGTG